MKIRLTLLLPFSILILLLLANISTAQIQRSASLSVPLKTLSSNGSPEDGGLASPAYLAAQINGYDVQLSWGMDSLAGNWLTYEKSEPLFYVGLNDPGIFSVASRWPAGALIDYSGKPVSKFAFVPASDFSTYTFKIFKGENAQILVYTQALTNFIVEQWNEIELNSFVVLEQGEDYWFSIEYHQLTNSVFPATADSGPAVVGFGDMINLGNSWEPLSNYGIDSNWSLRVFVADAGAEVAILPAIDDNRFVANSGLKTAQPGLSPDAFRETLLGFNIYRDGVKLNSDLVTELFYNDLGLNAGTYVYGVTAVYAEGESNPIEKTVLVNSGQLVLYPAMIDIVLVGGIKDTIPLTMTNTHQTVIEWQVDTLPSWISLSNISGTVEPNATQMVDVVIDGEGLTGTNNFVISFNTNSASNPVVLLPVTVNSAAPGLLDWSINPLDFGALPVLQTKMQMVSLINSANATTYFYGVYMSSEDFFVSLSGFSIPANSSLEIPVYFSPSTTGNKTGTLTVQYFNYLGSFTTELQLLGEGIVLPPANLSATQTGNEVTLSWFPPGFNPGELSFANGDPQFVIGTSGPGKYEFAHRFTSADLLAYSGKMLEAVSFYVNSVNTDFEVKIYTDEFAETPFLSLPVSGLTPDSWNTFTLPEPLDLDQLEFLWIGYQIDVADLEFIGVVDGGPGVTGSGDLVKIGETSWTTLGEFQLSYNWCIKGLLNNNQAVGFLPDQNENRNILTNNFLGYNVYKDGIKLTESPIAETSFTDEIVAGESWLYGVTAVFEIGESLPAEILVTAPASLVMPTGWEFTASSRVHTIHVPLNAVQPGLNLQNGDMIGVFYLDNGVEKCAGALEWDGENAILKAYGDDPETPWKEGFLQNESISWKIFFNQSQTSYPLTVTYSSQMPHHDGTFKMMGLSMLETLELGTVSVEEAETFAQIISLYPNPSTGSVTLSGLSGSERVTILDSNGRTVLTYLAGSSVSQFNIEKAGIYFVEIKGERELTRKKLIIR